MARRSLENLIINPEQIDALYPAATTSNLENNISFEGIFDASDLPSSVGSKVPYVIITNNTNLSGESVLDGDPNNGDFVQKFQQYANLKILKGVPAKVVTVDAIRANYPGNDVGEKIRRFIQDAHNVENWGTEYVLLGGGASIIPARRIGDVNRQHSDLYYSAIVPYDNNWDNNGNGYYNDSGDYTPDIAVGRAPVDTEAEVDNFLKKNIAYARFDDFSPLVQSLPDGDYLGKMLAAYGDAFNTGWNGSNPLYVGYGIIQAHHNDTYIHGMFAYNQEKDNNCGQNTSWSKAYYPLHGNCSDNEVEIDDENLTHNGILIQIENGYGIINLIDHMTPYRLSLGSLSGIQPLIAQDFQGLADTGKYGVFVAGGCQSARIEMDEYMGEQWVNSPGGGVAFYGTNIDINPGTSKSFNDNFFNLIYDENTVNYKLGWLHSYASAGSNTLFKMFQLLGDPEQSLYTKAPVGPLAMAYPNSITTGNQSFLVDVAFFPPGIDNITVGLYKEGEIMAHATAGPNDFPLHLNITPDTPGTMHVTVTGHNLEPYEGTAQVTTNPQLHLYKTNNITINDENNNGIIEPGETVNIGFELHNTGQENATGISAVLSSENPAVQITQPTSTYLNILAGQTGSSQVNYTFTAPPEAFRALAFQLDIHGSSNSGQHSFTEPFLLNMQSSDLKLDERRAFVDNEQTVMFQSSDQISLFIDLKNEGNIEAKGINAMLTTNLPANIASISDGSYTYGDIAVGDPVTNNQEFVINIGSGYNSQDLTFELTLTDAYGKTEVFEILLNEAWPAEITNFQFTSTDVKITPTWESVSGVKGYNIYRSDNENGSYVKVNENIKTTSMFINEGLTPLSEYWYKIGLVSLSGLEKPVEQMTPHLTNTQLQRHATFPITATPGYNGLRSSPIAYDVDGNGTKEIFIDHYLGNNIFDEGGRIMGFYESGEELFDIDADPSTVWGFARTFSSLSANPAIGDLDNDGLAEVIAIGRGSFTDFPTLYGFRTTDGNGDNKPDKLWGDGEIPLDHRTNRNPVLSDVNADGSLDIIVLNERQKITIYNADGTILASKQVGDNVDWSEGEIAVADIDGDPEKEIVFGCRAISTTDDRGAIYIWDFTDDSLQQIKVFSSGERADNGVVLADINNDHEYEILIVTRINQFIDGVNFPIDATGKVYALNTNGTAINPNWSGNLEIDLPWGPYTETLIPRLSVGDLNGDGNLEVAFGSSNKLYVLDNEGSPFSVFPVTISDSGESVPILADIDEDDAVEIIINDDGKLYAFNNDGTLCFGWPLQSDIGADFAATPFVGDIDADGYNEVIIGTDWTEIGRVHDNTTYVWDTTGDADKVEWGSYRGNAQNTGVYETAECMGQTSPELDLVIKDNLDDTGAEPNTTTTVFWASPDIWVRNQPDGLFVREHQNPEYSAANPPYIYVRIKNNGCITSSGEDQLKLYWTKASLGLGWPGAYTGEVFIDNVRLGDEVGSFDIPSLEPGREVILEIPWSGMPDPADYEAIDMENPWHFCFLARILSNDDTMSFPEISAVYDNISNNNNIVAKNVTVVDELENGLLGGSVAVGNPNTLSQAYTFGICGSR